MTATETHATTDAQDIRIAYLADHLDALPTLVDWEVTTWGHLAPSRTPDDVRASFMRRATRGATRDSSHEPSSSPCSAQTPNTVRP